MGEGQPRLGLRANWQQFALLVAVNGFVGAMVGLERTVLPLIAAADFELASRAAILSFLVSFGAAKALANLFAGRVSERGGRKRVLVAGWLVALPVPLILMAAPGWGWVILANVLLGINQGLCWSTAVIMKIDLVGPRRRGLAMGLNESAGYLAVALSALATGLLGQHFGLRPVPFYPGIAFALIGVTLSVFFVHDTLGHARLEARHLSGLGANSQPDHLSFAEVLLETSWRNKALFAASQAGLVNNLNDGMIWGLIPLFLAARGVPLAQIAVITAVYPGVWGLTQLLTGALSDRLGRKWLIAAGMWVQAAGIFLLVAGLEIWAWLAAAVLLGVGTALVYPTLLAAVSDVAHPNWRASAVGVYRLWRDGGYVAGAITAGVIADALGLSAAIAAVGLLTFLSGTVVAGVMYETLPARRFATQTGTVTTVQAPQSQEAPRT